MTRSFCVSNSIVEASVTNPGTSSLVATQTDASASQNAWTLNIIMLGYAIAIVVIV
jgi:hypothetical protein